MPFSPPGVADHGTSNAPIMTPWNKNRARRRRLQYWIKNSLRSFSQTDLFEEDEHHEPNESANESANGSIPDVVVPKNRVSMTAAAVTSPLAAVAEMRQRPRPNTAYGDTTVTHTSTQSSISTSSLYDDNDDDEDAWVHHAHDTTTSATYNCRDIDEAMYGLHTSFALIDKQDHDHDHVDADDDDCNDDNDDDDEDEMVSEEEYDWMLDGDPPGYCENEQLDSEMAPTSNNGLWLNDLELEDAFTYDMESSSPIRFGDFRGAKQTQTRNHTCRMELEPDHDDDDDDTTTCSSPLERIVTLEPELEHENDVFSDFVSAASAAKEEMDHSSSCHPLPDPNRILLTQHDATSQNNKEKHHGSVSKILTTTNNTNTIQPLTEDDALIPDSYHASSSQPQPQPKKQKSILLSLPMAHVSSPEGKFTRRRQLQLLSKDQESQLLSETTRDKDRVEKPSLDRDSTEETTINDSLEMDLPDEFFTPDYDPVLDVVQSLAWEKVLADMNNDDEPEQEHLVADEHDHDDESSQNVAQHEEDVDDNNMDDDNLAYLDHFLTQKLSHLDEAHNNVTTELIGRIQGKEDMIAESMTRVQDIDLHLAKAHMYAHTGHKYLEQARRGCTNHNLLDAYKGNTADNDNNEWTEGGGIAAGLDLIQDTYRRDLLKELGSITDRMAKLIDTERWLMSRINSFGRRLSKIRHGDFTCLIETATQLQEQLLQGGNAELGRLDCLAPLRDRVARIMDHLQLRVEHVMANFLSHSCRRRDASLLQRRRKQRKSRDRFFSGHTYEILLRARLSVHMHHNMQDTVVSLEQSWPDCILKALCYEADKCLARALLDPSTRGDEDEDEDNNDDSYYSNLLALRLELFQEQNGYGDLSKLQSITHDLITIRFDFESNRNHFRWVYHQTCLLLADVMHTHYLLTQWHRSPFDKQNNDETYLHRKATQPTTSEVVDGGTERTANDEKKNDASSDTRKDDTEFRVPLDDIAENLNKSKDQLWKHCESVLVKLLEEYIVQSSKKKKETSDAGANSNGENSWAVDLEGLHDVHQLSQQMLDLGRGFLGRVVEPSAEWLEKQCVIYRRHLRGVHVEAMNVMGAMLSHETWQLMPVDMDQVTTTDNKALMIQNRLERLLSEFSPLLSVDVRTSNLSTQRSWENHFHSNCQIHSDIFGNFLTVGNPFGACKCNKMKMSCNESTPDTSESNVETDDYLSESKNESTGSKLYSTIVSMMEGQPDGHQYLPLGTQSSINGLAKWTSRLLTILKKLPLIVDDVSRVISNLFDLYLLTVFRLCVGTGQNERIILGLEKSSHLNHLPRDGETTGYNNNNPAASKNRVLSLRQNSFSKKPKQQAKRQYTTPPVEWSLKNVEAGICTPLPKEMPNILRVREFVCRGQKSLEGMVNFDRIEGWLSSGSNFGNVDDEQELKDPGIVVGCLFEKRIGAACSSLFVAALLDVTRRVAQRNISSCDAIGSYTNSLVESVPTLFSLCTRMASLQAIDASNVVQQITVVGSRWEESRLFEHANDYVEDLCEVCASLWKNLSSVCGPRLPMPVRTLGWTYILSSAYLSLMEGFSRVLQCSTEGRALMSIDLATLASGISSRSILERLEGSHSDFVLERPPSVDLPSGKLYVDTYVKVFYYPEEDAMRWIIDNHESYQQNHSIGLIICGIGGRLGWSCERVTGMIKETNELYSM
eukprot:CAMPEP_0198287380 /NCGR_PEP_ID=MMETSP1449-20131203/6221_1 /TAXON_ID=420275 /ORGANISM="Attheya septentrionalis, Strain CCMP2084" /LENGTH=1679 /DNA_ID=CAMNT_0043985327 /DNA_START=160 /DNA_END=5199 /DNA_ORIENTATION=-